MVSGATSESAVAGKASTCPSQPARCASRCWNSTRACLVSSGLCLVLPDTALCCRIVKASITMMNVSESTRLGMPEGARRNRQLGLSVRASGL